MENIFKYLDDTQYDSIYDRPFNELDLLILTELAYLSFDGLVASDLDLDKSKRLQDIAENYPQEQSMMHTRNRLKLLEKASQTKRFKNIKLMGFINDIDLEIEKQFAALVYCIQSKPATYVLAYRGTDDSIIGWKEDFHMTYMDRVPAPKNAKKYLKEVLRELDGDFILTGHSKGGNLAAYAASQVNPLLQERIKKIYSYDAPGLNKAIIESDGYKAIANKIQHYIPQGSIVGMMLEIPKQMAIVKSTALGGLAQHDTFSWQIEGDSFVLLDSLNPDSLQTDKTLKNWVRSTSDEELKDFFDLFFGLVLDAGITSIDDFSKISNVRKVLEIFKNANALSDEEREMLTRLTSLLVDMRVQSWKDDISLPNLSEIGKDIRENLSRWSKQLPFGQSDTDKTEDTTPDVQE
ncbi:DUF2974 domain-containing protein [Streptococcus gordonii]|uniref:DUF2974 domain-containing protein n=1 Tax=Streptococcus gordonii TaxID=1302 RepID=UPI000779EE40|nr:DUF2974 domain-containing protein [Streptococcus gordonii]